MGQGAVPAVVVGLRLASAFSLLLLLQTIEGEGVLRRRIGVNLIVAICNEVPYGVFLFALMQKVTKKIKAVDDFGCAVGCCIGAQSKTLSL